MGSSYYQFCPVAKAMEMLDERWTLLVVRELISGSERFNELRRGLPRMSPTLLSKRMHQLVRAGIVERLADANDVRYALTPAGEELRPIVEALGAWGVRWIGELGEMDLDPKLLLWDMRRNVDHSAVPDTRTVISLRFLDVPPKINLWWMVLTREDADVCDADPGYPVALTVTASLRRMVEVWLGEVTWEEVLRTGDMDVQGAEYLRRALSRWFTLSPFAAVPRPARPPVAQSGR